MEGLSGALERGACCAVASTVGTLGTHEVASPGLHSRPPVNRPPSAECTRSTVSRAPAAEKEPPGLREREEGQQSGQSRKPTARGQEDAGWLAGAQRPGLRHEGCPAGLLQTSPSSFPPHLPQPQPPCATPAAPQAAPRPVLPPCPASLCCVPTSCCPPRAAAARPPVTLPCRPACGVPSPCQGPAACPWAARPPGAASPPAHPGLQAQPLQHPSCS